MNGKLANFFRILGANMAGIATVLGFILAGYGAFLIMVCGGLLFVLAFILLLPDNEGR